MVFVKQLKSPVSSWNVNSGFAICYPVGAYSKHVKTDENTEYCTLYSCALIYCEQNVNICSSFVHLLFKALFRIMYKKSGILRLFCFYL